MRINYRLTGTGWANCEVEIDGQTATVTASYMSHALDDLLAAALAVARGEAEATASFEEEPGEYRWRLHRVDPDRLRVRILSFDDFLPEGRLADERGETLLDAECRLRTFAGAVLSAAQRVLERHGTVGYRREWVLADFPMERMNALKAALNPDGAEEPDAAANGVGAMVVTKEELHRVFGPRAFGDGLFYTHEKEGALRLELSRGGHWLDQFEQAYDRGREIVDHLFRDSERLVVAAAWCGTGPLLRHLSVFRSLRACGVRIAKPRAAWTESGADDCFDEGGRTVVAFACEKEALHRLLWGAIAVDLGIRPKLECRLYLADPERGILAHPYDDRGMDVIGPNKGLLKELYDVFNLFLLDYDRERMDAFFLARDEDAG